MARRPTTARARRLSRKPKAKDARTVAQGVRLDGVSGKEESRHCCRLSGAQRGRGGTPEPVDGRMCSWTGPVNTH